MKCEYMLTIIVLVYSFVLYILTVMYLWEGQFMSGMKNHGLSIW